MNKMPPKKKKKKEKKRGVSVSSFHDLSTMVEKPFDKGMGETI